MIQPKATATSLSHLIDNTLEHLCHAWLTRKVVAFLFRTAEIHWIVEIQEGTSITNVLDDYSCKDEWSYVAWFKKYVIENNGYF